MLNAQEIEERINRNERTIKKLDETYIKAFCPQSGGGTSYEDYDSIHGTRKEYRVEDYFKAKQRLLTMIDLDKQLLVSAGIETEDEIYLSYLENNEQKVKYLRRVKGYTQEKTAEKLGISDRQVRRIEKRIL